MGKNINFLFANKGQNNAPSTTKDDGKSTSQVQLGGNEVRNAPTVDGKPEAPQQSQVAVPIEERAVPQTQASKPQPALAFGTKKNEPTAAPVTAQPAEAVPAEAPSSLISVSQSLTMPADDFNHPSQAAAFAETQVVAIKNALKILEDNLEDKHVVSDSVRNVLLTMKKFPETAEMLEDEDYQIMVRGLRASYGSVLVAKQGRKKAKTDKAIRTDQAMDMLKGYNFDFDMGG